VETLEIVASSLRSGFGFVQSVELAAREQRDPIASELAQCIREINLGAGTDEALTRLVERAGDPDLELAVDAVVIQRRVGGDLSEVLGNIAHMIRERIRIRGEINTLTAQARMSSWIIGLLPAALAGAMALLQPEHMRLLIEHPVGRLMVGVAILMEVVGFLLIRRIASIEY
jgi:tight adherence protein B